MLYQSRLNFDSEQSTDLNRQVQFLNNIETKNELEQNGEIHHFLVTNMFILIQIDIQRKNNNKSATIAKEEQFPRKYTDLF